ncbi:ATP-binding protein [Haloarchaeobius sp. TZWSO28]|uniref:PAS domain-containing sensor histidine kinase n=1 Tax=Haloarchaeobius sp. TZWSO28 TaxID=3446119 RepID=UPI003EBEF6A9
MAEYAQEISSAVLEALVDNLPDGVLVEDETREIIVVNSALCDVLDLDTDPEGLLGQDCAAAGATVADSFVDSAEFMPRIEELLDRREPVSGESLRLVDGRTLERTYVPYTLPDGEANLWVYRDVTERVEQANALEAKNERLEAFASMVSHDIRTPLSVATTRLQLAQETCDCEHLTEAERSLERMDELTQQLLVLAREGKAVHETGPVPLSVLVSQCWNNVESENAVLENEAEGTVVADWNRLAQLFENLFSNAVEHGRRGTGENGDDTSRESDEVRVRVGLLEDGFYVEDNGTGLAVDEPERIFRTDFSTSEHGTGLGLKIVEEIVDAHDWDIAVDTTLTAGVRFEVTGVSFETETEEMSGSGYRER